MIKCLANLPVNLIRRLARTVVASTNMFSELYDVGFEMSDYKRQEQPVACWCEYKGKFKNELFRWGKCWQTSVLYCVYWKYIEPVLKLVARKVPETSLMLTPPTHISKWYLIHQVLFIIHQHFIFFKHGLYFVGFGRKIKKFSSAFPTF